TFTAPSNPGGTFAGTATVFTDASGRATAPAFTADGTAGSYQVIATASGGTNPTAVFALTNTPASAAPHAAVAVVFATPAGPARATGTTPPGAAAGTVVGVNAFATIQAALDDAAPGGTVNLAAGNYTENLSLSRSVILNGAGSGQTTLTGAGQ